MNSISFFGLKVKPKFTCGKGMWDLLITQITKDGSEQFLEEMMKAHE